MCKQRIASKSIASKALAIAKKREAERLEKIKEDFLNIMQKEFEERVKNCDPWTAIGTNAYIYREEMFIKFHSTDLKTVCEDVGFIFEYTSCGQVRLSIPEWVKGQKRTKAQLMLYWSNIEINRTIKSRKEQAKKACKETLEKIKEGNFITLPKYFGFYSIVVTVSSPLEDNFHFKDTVIKFFEKRNFLVEGFDTGKGELSLRVIEEDV